MSVKQFEDRTSVAFAMRGKKLEMIRDNLDRYIRAQTEDNLKSLWNMLLFWQTPHQVDQADRDSWMADRRNRKSAISDLTNWVARKRCEPAIIVFKRAAKEVDAFYGQYMEKGYSKALHDIFIDSEVDSTAPFTSLVYWSESSVWAQRLKAVPGWSTNMGNTTGFTDTWDSAKLDAIFRTRRPGAGIADPNPPFNRIVEVSHLEVSTAFHELLHWVTHHDFKVHFDAITDVNLRKFVVEGGTEFLTRKARGDWDHGGYADLIPIWIDMMKDSSVLTLSEFTKAYFGGTGLAEVEAKLKAFTSKNKLYQDALKDAFRKAIANYAKA